MEPPDPFPAARQALSGDSTLAGVALCRAYSDLVDRWLGELFASVCTDASDIALVAVGGYGRRELSLQSDIDLVLLHSGRRDVRELAPRIWYPIWDEGLKLGHAVRTPKEAISLASSDIETATSLLSARLVAGSEELASALAEQSLGLWRKRSRRWLDALGEGVSHRQRRFGEVAFLLEPDLKSGRGGLRDVQAIRWAEAADRVMLEGDDEALSSAYEVLLGARVELHRRTGRPGDVLLLQEQDAVAAALGDADADALMARIAAAARTIAWRSDEVWDSITATLGGGIRWRSARDREIERDILLRDGRVHLDSSAEPSADPAAVLRVAAAAARQGTRIARGTLERLREEAALLPEPWPDEARRALVDLLAAGPAAIGVIEALDQQGLWTRLIPEWEPCRSKPQRNAYHRFTVDRHLCEAAVEASQLTDRVERPDLLLVAALLHDIGKGYPGDHTEVGVELVERICKRMGLADDDTAVITLLVQQHLLLPDVATRRDLADDATIQLVAEKVGTVQSLRLLAALTEADSIATGPAAWGGWKAELVADLVARTEHALGAGGEIDVPVFPSPAQIQLLEAREPLIEGADDRLTIVQADRPGLFSRVAGALALNGLDVLDAAAYTHDNGMALEVFRVESSFGPTISWDRIVREIEAAIDGRLALEARLSERARVYGLTSARGRQQIEVVFDAELSPKATVLEVHAPDSVGLLFRLTHAMADLDLDIRSAKVQTLGPDVVDSFYLVDRDGGKVTDPGHLAEIERAIRHALSA